MGTRPSDEVAWARLVLAEIQRPGCSIWACQIDELIERLVRRVERAERLGDAMAEACGPLLGVVDALMPGVAHIAVQDYAALNEAPGAARRAAEAWARARGAAAAEGGGDAAGA